MARQILFLAVLFFSPNTAVLASEGPAGPDQSICGTSAVLAAEPLASGEVGFWQLISGAGTFASASSPATSITGLALGDNLLRWTVFGNGETQTDDLYITVYDPALPPAFAGPDSALCEADPSMHLQAGDFPSGVVGTWNVNSGQAIVASPSNPHSLVTVQGGGPVTLSWIVYNGPCGTSDDEVVLSVQECVVGLAEVPASSLRVYFDQAQQRIIVDTSVPVIGLDVFDALGRVVHRARPTAAKGASVPMPTGPDGVYLVSVRTTAATFVRRITVAR